MCFGTFHSGKGNCDNCPVMRSCRRESLKNLSSKKEKRNVLRVRTNSIDRFGRSKAKIIITEFLRSHKSPASTYRLTKDFKRHYNINISDSTILSLCAELMNSRIISFKMKGKARYWYLV